jgi:hypothetical protein
VRGDEFSPSLGLFRVPSYITLVSRWSTLQGV